MPPTVFAIPTEHRDNADLMVECVRLGYLPPVGSAANVLDATYGKGRFWTKHQPSVLWANDLHTDPIGNVPHVRTFHDFRRFPAHWGHLFFSVVLDPPYKLNGTPDSGGPAASDADYGVHEKATVAERMQLIFDGLTGCMSVVEPGGYLLVKCQDQVVSGAVYWQTDEVRDHVLKVRGWKKIDRLEVVGYRKQPERTRKCPDCGGVGWTVVDQTFGDPAGAQEQCPTCEDGRVPSPQQHAARNHSSLLVFRKPRR